MAGPSTGPAAALDGVRVLDASNVLAGPFCGMILGDFGADVVKLEHPADGDPIRHHAPIVDGAALMWKMLGRNKRSVGCDFGDEAHRDAFRRACEQADVVILTFRSSRLAAWGLDPDALLAVNPRLVVATVSGFGLEGPLADAAGFGTLAEAMSGYAYRNGFPDSPPVLPPFGLADSVAGMNLALGVVLALQERERSGQGQHVAVSLVDSLVTLLQPQNAHYAAAGAVAGRIGNRSSANAPRELYRCADGEYVAISCSTNSTAYRLLSFVDGGDEVAAQEWFGQPHGRATHADEIDEVLQPWFAQRSMPEALALLLAAEIPAAPVHNAATMATDEQLRANRTLVEVPEPDGDGPTVTMPNVHIRLSRTPGTIRWPGRDLAADGRSVDEWAAGEESWS